MSRPIATLFGGFGRVGITDMDSPLATHVHPHLHVILKLDGAETLFQVRDRFCPVNRGSAVLVNAWEPHAWPFQRSAGPTRFLTLYLEPAWLAATGLDDAGPGPGPFFASPSVNRSAAAESAIGSLYRSILASTRDITGSVWEEEVEIALITLISELRLAARTADPQDWSAPAFDYRIRRAMKMLYLQSEPLSVETVADSVGLSRPRFFELFKQCTGMTPTRVTSAARMERAISLLSGSDMSMGDLAADLHFASPGNFSRFFRSQIGLSPHAFRRSSIRHERPGPTPPAPFLRPASYGQE